MSRNAQSDSSKHSKLESVANAGTTPASGLRRAFAWSLKWGLRTFVWAGLIATLLGAAGGSDWRLDLLSHVRPQAVLAFAPLVVLALGLRQLPTAALALVGLGCNLASIVPFYLAPNVQADSLPADPEAALHIFYANVLQENEAREPLFKLIRAQQPDLIAVLEVSEAWARDLNAEFSAWPHRIVRSHEDHFGIALYSRFPLEKEAWPVLFERSPPVLTAEVQWQGLQVPIILGHAFQPLSPWNHNNRNHFIKALSELPQTQNPRAILVADLNVTPWSSNFDPLANSPLRDVRKGYGIQPSWNTALPSLLHIPIDYILVGKAWSVPAFEIGEPFESDHLPLLVELR